MEAVLDCLFKKPVPISDAVALQRKSKSRRRIKKTRRKPAQTAVSERRVLDLLEYVDINSLLCKDISCFIQNAEFHEIIEKTASYQKFHRKIISVFYDGSLLLAQTENHSKR